MTTKTNRRRPEGCQVEHPKLPPQKENGDRNGNHGGKTTKCVHCGEENTKDIPRGQQRQQQLAPRVRLQSRESCIDIVDKSTQWHDLR